MARHPTAEERVSPGYSVSSVSASGVDASFEVQQLGWKHIAVGIALLIGVRVIARVAYRTPSLADLPSLVVVVALFTAYWVPASAVILWISRKMAALRSPKEIQISIYLLVGVVVVVTEPAWVDMIAPLLGYVKMPYGHRLLNRAPGSVMLVALIVGVIAVRNQIANLRSSELDALRLKEDREACEFYVMGLQLQPHFLFNTLQLIAELAHRNEQWARETLDRLRHLVLVSFEFGSFRVKTVAEEVGFLCEYIEIQKARFGNRIQFRVDVDEPAMHATVPPMLLQPLVENSIRHGLRSRETGGTVTVQIRREGNTLVIVVADNGDGCPRDCTEGLGLRVTRRRLETLYGAAHRFEFHSEKSGVTARMELPFRDSRTVAASSTDATKREQQDDIARDRKRVTLGIRLLSVWAFVVMVTFGADVLVTRITRAHTSLTPLLEDRFVSVPFWILLTAAAIVTARRTVRMTSFGKALVLHMIVGSICIAFHVVVGPMLYHGVFPDMRASPGMFLLWIPWDSAAYTLAVAFTRAGDVGQWAEARAANALRLRALLNRSNRRLDVLRLHQQILIAALDAISRRSRPMELDEAAIQCSEFVRELLARSEDDWIEVSEDAGIAARFLALRTDTSIATASFVNQGTVPLVVPPGTLAVLCATLLLRSGDLAQDAVFTFATDETSSSCEVTVMATHMKATYPAAELADLKKRFETLTDLDATLSFKSEPGCASLTLSAPSLSLYGRWPDAAAEALTSAA